MLRVRQGGSDPLLVRVGRRLRSGLALHLRETRDDYVDRVRNNELHMTGDTTTLRRLQETHDHRERLTVHVEENMGVVRQRRVGSQGTANVLFRTENSLSTFSSTRDE